MTCKRIVLDFDHPGMVKEIEVPDHAFSWTGPTPCCGMYQCMFCGKPEDPTSFNGKAAA